jgi:uncharacterized DUF497 family protein
MQDAVEPDEIVSPEFEWDENKRLSNVEKHGIDFVDCLDVFLDRDAFIYLSMRSKAEKRYVIIGHVGKRSISVVFTRRGPLIRLISARSSRRNERRQYETRRQKKD